MRERVENGADPTHIRPEVVGVLCAGSFVCDIVAAGLPQIGGPGDLIYAPHGISLSVGGHSANVSIDLVQLGQKKVAAAGCIGNYIIQDMEEAGVPHPKGITFTQNTKMEMAQLLKQRMSEGTFRMPFDRETLDELNVEKYELTKTGKISFSHPDGTHDDRFWAVALAVLAAEQAPSPPSRPIARVI